MQSEVEGLGAMPEQFPAQETKAYLKHSQSLKAQGKKTKKMLKQSPMLQARKQTCKTFNNSASVGAQML